MEIDLENKWCLFECFGKDGYPYYQIEEQGELFRFPVHGLASPPFSVEAREVESSISNAITLGTIEKVSIRTIE